jgi:hypothetical protein
MPLVKGRPDSALRLAAIGAISFWLPDFLLHVLFRMYSEAGELWYVMFVLPIAFAAAYIRVCRRADKNGFKYPGVAMFLGVWFTGGLFIMLEWNIVGGPAWPGGFQNNLMWAIMCLFPPITAFMSAYDGSLPGLLALTVGAALFVAVRAGIPQIQLPRSRK